MKLEETKSETVIDVIGENKKCGILNSVLFTDRVPSHFSQLKSKL